MIVTFDMARFQSVVQAAIATSSIRKFAQRCGLNHVTVYRVAYQSRKVEMNEYAKICTALDIEPSAFFTVVQHTEKMF
jgi:DNA-binding Xre family transcriptional regulator